MTFERSNGKLRPRLPRSSDARPADTDDKPSDTRAAHGHFAPGNKLAVGAGFKHAIKKVLGTKEAPGEGAIVAKDSRLIAKHVLAALPSNAAPVQVLVNLHARHVALNAYYTAKAEAVGFDTPEGMDFIHQARLESQRAERVLVTAQDQARICVEENKRRDLPALPWQVEVVPDPK